MTPVEFTVPIRTVSRANQQRGQSKWAALKRAKAVREERAATRIAALTVGLAQQDLVPCRVLLTRVSPRLLDNDNAAGAVKAVRDEVAAILGVDDRDPRVIWLPVGQEQKPKTHAVRVTITPGLGAVAEFRGWPPEGRQALANVIRERLPSAAGDLAARVLEEVA